MIGVRHVGELGAVVAVDDRGVALRPSSHTAQTDARRDQLRLKLRQAFFWDRQDAPGMRLRRPTCRAPPTSFRARRTWSSWCSRSTSARSGPIARRRVDR